MYIYNMYIYKYIICIYIYIYTGTSHTNHVITYIHTHYIALISITSQHIALLCVTDNMNIGLDTS